MTTILQLNASMFGDAGQSSHLADAFVARLAARETDSRVIRRDFASEPVPHLTADRFNAILAAPDQRDERQVAEAAASDAYLGELLAADVVVIGLPMYNFNIPSTLKAWFDHVARAGTTFRYTPKGPEGLLKNKRAIVIVTSGGKYSGTGFDLQSPYVRQFLGFIGIEDVKFVYAEGLAMGEDSRRQALDSADTCITALAA